MSRGQYQCAQEKDMGSICFPPEKVESRLFLLFICPGVPLRSGLPYILDPIPCREEKRDMDDLGWETAKHFK